MKRQKMQKMVVSALAILLVLLMLLPMVANVFLYGLADSPRLGAEGTERRIRIEKPQVQ